ncbi:Intraflagellar transport protein 27 [Allomyces arbusculus]|nr:Intraflagellar transport protein 27 [Allomyces arbusculus]
MSTPASSSRLCLRTKVVLLGDSGTGKSALAQVFHSEGASFPKAHMLNTTPELLVKTVAIPDTDAAVELFVTDLPGLEPFLDVTKRHAHGASAFLLVFDSTNKDSFSGIGKWLKVAKTLRESEPLIGCLVATKCDLTKRRAVPAQQAQDVARSLDLEYFECSAATNFEVDSIFYYIANATYEAYEEHIKGLVGDSGS